MSFSRTHRLDRRRRIVRESAASTAAAAGEYARPQKKVRRGIQSDPEAFFSSEETPNYSQDVRKTCQQRLVQWIPIRTQSVAIFISGCWVVWGLLLASHYLLHTRANSLGRSPIPVLQLLDLRSPHSIANWMTCQLWLLTAFASWMVYSIRQHRLDDFSATYRIWYVMIGLSLFSCFDTATSATYLLGQSIDPWTRREIGYGGWPLILAAYASIVALVGLRLSSEMRLSRAAVSLWFGGLLAWGCAALLGTGLLKLQWSPGLIDLVVGGCWLGGVLAVFQAVGLVLRRCYMQAQRRFIERAVLSKPKLEWEEDDSQDDESQEQEEETVQEPVKKSWLPWRRSRDDESSEKTRDRDEDQDRSVPSSSKKVNAETKEPKRPMRLFGLFPHRVERNEQLGENEPLRIEDQVPVDQGLTKKSGWFPKRETTNKETSNNETTKKETTKKETVDEETSKRSWFGSMMRKKTEAERTTEAPASTEAKNPKSVDAKQAPKESQVQESGMKKSWFAIGRKNAGVANSQEKSAEVKPASATPSSSPLKAKTKEPEMVEAFEILDEESPKKGKLVKKLFGWFDGLKLKPPKDNATTATSTAAKSAPESSNHTSSAASPATNKPQHPSADYEDDEFEEDNSDYRHLSKAERKRLRRQQNDRGAA